MDWIQCRLTPFDDPYRGPDDFAKKQRLGHGRRLEVEQVGIGGEEGEGERRSGGWEPMARQPVDARTGGQIRKRRGDHARDSVGPPAIDGNKRNQQEMG